MTREEAKQFLEELLAKGQQERDYLVRTVREEIERWRKETALATKADIERLEAELKELKALLRAKESE